MVRGKVTKPVWFRAKKLRELVKTKDITNNETGILAVTLGLNPYFKQKE